MSVLNIRGQNIDVDVRSELENFEWTKPRWTSEKLIAASPFRYDNNPSFFVRLEPYGNYPAGVWADLGFYDEEWRSGNFVRLLAFLRNETYEETEEYLLTKYGRHDDGKITLRPPRFSIKRDRQTLDFDVAPTATDYLLRRGISPDIQRLFGVGYDAAQKAIILPWRLPDGRLANVKYRKTYGKAFWYERDGWPIRELVYGMDLIFAQNIRKAALVEAEIDALSCWTVGVPAIAVGGATFNEMKRDIILRSPIEELVILTDNDKAGERLRAEIERMMKGRMRLKNARIEGGWKDANETLIKGGAEALKRAIDRAESCRVLTSFMPR